MTKISINGDIDDACAKLKAILDAQDDRFKANLQAMSKSSPSVHTPAAPAAQPSDSSGRSRSMKRNYAGTLRIRLRP